MKKSEVKAMRAAFIGDLAEQLAHHGEVWSGGAARCICAPHNRVIYVDRNRLLWDVTTEGLYSPTESLVRVRVNERWILPKKIDRLKLQRGSQCLEISLRDVDLPDLVPYVVALVLGQVTETRSYVWDPRAIKTLPQEGQAQLARSPLELVLEQKGGR